LIIVPFPITDPGTFWAEITDLSDKAGKSWQGQEQNWSGFLLFRSIWISEGVVTSLLALAGVVLLCKEKKWEYLLFPLLYLLLVFTHELYFMRFAMPLLPWIALFAASAVLRITDSVISNRQMQPIALGILLVSATVQPVLQDLRSNDL